MLVSPNGIQAHRIDAGSPAIMYSIIRQWPKPRCHFLTLLIFTINQYLPAQTPAFTNLEMSFYNFNLTAEEVNSLPKHLHPGHMFAIAKLLSVLRRAFEAQDPELHRKGLLAATVSHQLHHHVSHAHSPRLRCCRSWPPGLIGSASLVN